MSNLKGVALAEYTRYELSDADSLRQQITTRLKSLKTPLKTLHIQSLGSALIDDVEMCEEWTDSLHKIILQLNEKIRDSWQQKESLIQRCMTEFERFDDLTKQHTLLQNKHDAKAEALKKEKDELASMRPQIAQYALEQEKAEITTKALRAEIAQLKNKVGQTESKNQSLSAKLSSTTKALQEQTEKNDQLQKKHSDTQGKTSQENERLRNELKSLKDKSSKTKENPYKAEMEALKEQLNDSEKKIAILTKQLEESIKQRERQEEVAYLIPIDPTKESNLEVVAHLIPREKSPLEESAELTALKQEVSEHKKHLEEANKQKDPQVAYFTVDPTTAAQLASKDREILELKQQLGEAYERNMALSAAASALKSSESKITDLEQRLSILKSQHYIETCKAATTHQKTCEEYDRQLSKNQRVYQVNILALTERLSQAENTLAQANLCVLEERAHVSHESKRVYELQKNNNNLENIIEQMKRETASLKAEISALKAQKLSSDVLPYYQAPLQNTSLWTKVDSQMQPYADSRPSGARAYFQRRPGSSE